MQATKQSGGVEVSPPPVVEGAWAEGRCLRLRFHHFELQERGTFLGSTVWIRPVWVGNR